MAWSTTAPSLPSGVSWGNTATVYTRMNRYTLSGSLQSARGSGSTFYVKLTVTFSEGSQYEYNPPSLYLLPGGTYAGNNPAGGQTRTWYYTGSSASSGSIQAGISPNSSQFETGAAYNTVSYGGRLTYAITYYGNGSTGGSTAGQTHTSGTATTISANGFTRPGYAFTGWNTKADGTGTPYSVGASYNSDAALNLYAQWIKSNIPVYVNVGGTVKQVEKAYVNIGGTVKEADIYINVNGSIKAII